MFVEREIHNIDTVKPFLTSLGLKLPKNLDYILGIFYDEVLVGTGSIVGKTLQGIGVDCNFQNEGILGKIITHLMKKSIEMGNDEIYVYTKPPRAPHFESYGFKTIGMGKYAVLLEWSQGGVDEFKANLNKLALNHTREGSSIVINANPMTLGHLSLIERAAKESPWLYLFVVEEDLSLFPFPVRLKLIKEGTKHIKNMSIIPGEQYIISSLTFPSYFTREEDLIKAHIDLDLEIFCNHIAPTLNITKRYVGTEPYCEVTREYNETMKRKLKEYGIDIKEVPRTTVNGEIISASKVRDLIRLERISETKKYLPKTTYDFLLSNDAKDIILRIQNSTSRH